MTDINADDNLEPEGSGGAHGDNEGGAGGGSATPQEWTGPSRDEWTTLQEQNRRLAESLEGLTTAFGTVEPERGGGFDVSQIDMTDPYQAAWLMDQIVQERLQGVTPYVRNAAQDQGQRQMQELLATHETELKKDFPGGFDHKLAERAAFAFFDETGDAEGSVAQAARYAAEVRKQERDAAINEYQTKNRKGGAFFDPDASSSGVRAPEPLKSYDDVLEKWALQSEA